MNVTLRRISRTLLAASSLALVFHGYSRAEGESKPLPKPAMDASLAKAAGQQTAVFAGGCFWGVEAVFKHVNGVISSTSGYAGGNADTADYDKVSTGKTGHAEAVKVVYDPARVSYGTLLKVLFSAAHDPTQLNRQGPDRGTQYRSAIFSTTDEQQKIAQAYVSQLQAANVYSQPIVTQIAPLKAFYQAEDYHLNYLARNPTQPYIVNNDLPKLSALKKEFPDLYRGN
ncbi:MAG: peptide-methionine (S)-S-oxide reductase MsrA [Burkholderiales bacterium]